MVPLHPDAVLIATTGRPLTTQRSGQSRRVRYSWFESRHRPGSTNDRNYVMAPQTPTSVEPTMKTLDYSSSPGRLSSLGLRRVGYGAVAVILAFAAADVDFVATRTDHCSLTGSWQTRSTTALIFASSVQRPSALDIEATRRGIAVQYAWKQVSESRRSLLSQSVACNTTFVQKIELIPIELAAMSDDEIQMLISRPADAGP